MKIEIKILNKEFYATGTEVGDGSVKTDLPSYATRGSAAMDLYCTENITVYPGETKMIPTGLAIWVGSAWVQNGIYQIINGNIGYAGFIVPRSGLGTKGLVLANTIGLIDEDYQGELKIAAWNRHSPLTPIDWETDEMIPNDGNIIELKAGDRIAQLMFVPVIKAQWDVVEEFSEDTTRGPGGFGSTGG